MAEQGRATPLDIKPEIEDPDYAWYFETFMRLHTTRPVVPMSSHSMPILFSEYLAYFQIFEPLEDVETDVRRLMRIDSSFVSIRNQNHQPAPPKPKARTPRRGR